ncbi:MAG: FCD domain-containing protein [Planctomycetota bacterium]
MRTTKNASVVERVTGAIRGEIERKRLGPGDVIATEGDLAKELGASRNAVREAVGRLRGLGLVDSRQSKGVVVLRSDPAQVLEMVLPQYAVDGASLAELGELRYAIEMGAAEIAVQRATKEDLARLRELGEEFREVVVRDQEAADGVDERFHTALLAATHNRLLSDMQAVVSGFFRRASREVEGWYRKEVTVEWEHIAIAQAMEEGDGDKVRGILRGHLKRSLLGEGDGRTSRKGAKDAKEPSAISGQQSAQCLKLKAESPVSRGELYAESLKAETQSKGRGK